ncbi:hypothetical protein CMO90_03965 [Candidatus Woesearchaeota archaeon]|jgi:hypothetical protein|nr:hypothetical protein [Candidatus Woesearchaeota archaeon]|tara:strand:- start:1421 stop:1990 length:570 start_codon:yes stop_codon:yes gene_type:complete
MNEELTETEKTRIREELKYRAKNAGKTLIGVAGATIGGKIYIESINDEHNDKVKESFNEVNNLYKKEIINTTPINKDNLDSLISKTNTLEEVLFFKTPTRDLKQTVDELEIMSKFYDEQNNTQQNYIKTKLVNTRDELYMVRRNEVKDVAFFNVAGLLLGAALCGYSIYKTIEKSKKVIKGKYSNHHYK